MKLYHSPTSPYVRKVMITLLETGQRDEVELVPTSGTPLAPAPGFSARNPLTKVPALERAEGATLYDSRVICQYLDARVGGGLYPGGERRWEVLTLEATGDGILDAALLMVYEKRLRAEDARSDKLIEAQWAKISQACDALEARWLGHLAGRIDAGQIAVACALGYLDLRHEARNWRAGRTGLSSWFAGFSERDSFTRTAPPV
ncbi:Glutathione S-transferase [Poseidonocella pacifica]|uniref:Glutathione S-transferase n=1 Tax=Poseidonocella pacifica TaxID=871651 RepID=A0A1I0XCG8_9RHOB|nr:glutathione S-transferase [Poseidonocella pacifica]SFA98671.1 Glutathione S-transferase [Poseidonocella pacifica]